MGWIDPRVRLGWELGRDFPVFSGFGWIGSTVPKIPYVMRITLN